MGAGAIDFFFTPVQMKKGRPGVKLTVLVSTTDLQTVAAFLLEETTTIGIRYYTVQRQVLRRRSFEVETPYGKVWVKEVTTPEGTTRSKIEYESLRKLKEIHNISILRLQEAIYPIIQKKS